MPIVSADRHPRDEDRPGPHWRHHRRCVLVLLELLPPLRPRRADPDSLLQAPSSRPRRPTTLAPRLSRPASPTRSPSRSSTGACAVPPPPRATSLTPGSFLARSFCSSGLMAVSHVAGQIRNGEIDIGFAVGFESMSATCVLLFLASLSTAADSPFPPRSPDRVRPTLRAELEERC